MDITGQELFDVDKELKWLAMDYTPNHINSGMQQIDPRNVNPDPLRDYVYKPKKKTRVIPLSTNPTKKYYAKAADLVQHKCITEDKQLSIIAMAVANHYDVPVATLYMKSRKREVIQYRQLAYYTMLVEGASIRFIAKHFNCDRDAIRSGYNMVCLLMKEDIMMLTDYMKIKQLLNA